CSHHGIINILMTAAEKFGGVSGVIGGFHLNGIRCYGFRRKKEPYAEMRAIAKYLKSNKIKNIYTGHCTGEKPLEKLELLARVKKMHSGDIIEV
ncbi:MAG: MBL fold metallo-hydrolase, partial [Eubacteriales bacterium]|nr:MBL fold metallo-hydrolase [Eubacteriales bacterium]